MNNSAMAARICRKLGISTDELNSLYTACPVGQAVGTRVAERIRERFNLPGPDEVPLGEALMNAGVLTPGQAVWLSQ